MSSTLPSLFALAHSRITEFELDAQSCNSRYNHFYHGPGTYIEGLHDELAEVEAEMQEGNHILLSEGLGTYKGYIVENLIATELFSQLDADLNTFEKGQSEIEFIIQIGDTIVPLEVKSSSKSRKAKSLDSYVKRYAPKLAYKLSAQNYGYNRERGYVTLPLYLIAKIFQ